MQYCIKIDLDYFLLIISEKKRDIVLKKLLIIIFERFLLYRGNIKVALRKYEAAKEDYNKLIEINPSFSEAYRRRGVTKFLLTDYTGAIEDYSHAIEHQPDFAMAYYLRGNAKQRLEDFQGAIQEIEIAQEFFLKKGKMREYQLLDEHINFIKSLK